MFRPVADSLRPLEDDPQVDPGTEGPLRRGDRRDGGATGEETPEGKHQAAEDGECGGGASSDSRNEKRSRGGEGGAGAAVQLGDQEAENQLKDVRLQTLNFILYFLF